MGPGYLLGAPLAAFRILSPASGSSRVSRAALPCLSTPAPMASTASAARPPLAELPGNDDVLISSLQQRLASGGRLIKKEHLVLAVQLSRHGALEPRTVFKNAHISSSGETRKRILGYRDRILREGLLAQCANAEPLDAEAADEERRAKKAKQRHDQREHWSELSGVLDAMIVQLERQAERAAKVRLQGLTPWCWRAAQLAVRAALPTAGAWSFGSGSPPHACEARRSRRSRSAGDGAGGPRAGPHRKMAVCGVVMRMFL